MDTEAFVITNNRSTLDYVIKSIESQSVNIPVTIIRDMKWIDAVNECVSKCKSRFYFRIDDDMILHPLCFEYMHYMATSLKRKSLKKMSAYACKLWEDWTNRAAGSLKMYQTPIVQRMGGFRVNKLGKIDKTFNADSAKHGHIIAKDNSMVGIHALGEFTEQMRYRELWLKNSKANVKPRWYMDAQKRYGKNIEEQYNLIGSLYSRNRKRKTGFGRYIRSKK